MPYSYNPLDALKKLLGGGSADLNAGDPTGMVQGRLGQENQAEEDVRSYENAQSNPHVSFSGATPSVFKNLGRVLSESPNFGTAADQRVKDITSANDKAMQAGFIGDTDIATPVTSGGGPPIAANMNRGTLSPAQQQGQNATKMELMKTQMPLLTEQAKQQGAIDLANRKRGNSEELLKMLRGDQGQNGVQRAGDRTSVNINPDGEMSINSTMGVAPKFSMQEQSAMNSAHTVNDLGERVMGNYEKTHPDIATNPDKYSSMMDAIPSMLGGRFFYSHGAKVPEFLGGEKDDSQTRQLIGAIQMNAARAIATGRLSGPVLDFVQKHLPDGGYSMGENYQRIKTLHDIIGPSILEGIAQGHGLESGQLPGGGAGDPYSDPNWGRR